MHLCLSQSDDVMAVSSRYADVFCLRAHHTACARFVHADQQIRAHQPSQPGADETVELKRSPFGADEAALLVVGETEQPTPSVPETQQPSPSVAETQRLPPSLVKTQPLSAATITTPVSGARSPYTTLTVAGSAPPRSRVRLVDRTAPVGMAVADASGAWSVTLHAMEPGDHIYKAEVLDAEGRVVGISSPSRVRIDPPGEDAPVAPSPPAPALPTPALPAPTPSIPSLPASIRPMPTLPDRRVLLAAAGLILLVIVALGALVFAARSGKRHGGQPSVASHVRTPVPKATPTSAVPVVVVLTVTVRPTSAPTASPTTVSTATAPPTPTATARPTPKPPATPSPVATVRPVVALHPKPTAAPTPQPTAPPRPTATPVKRPVAARPPGPTPTPTIPPPALTWHFAALRQPADQVILTLANPNKFAVDVQVRILGQGSPNVKRVTIPAASGTEMELSTQAASSALSLTASGPIVPERLIIRHNGVVSTYGHPGPGTP